VSWPNATPSWKRNLVTSATSRRRRPRIRLRGGGGFGRRGLVRTAGQCSEPSRHRVRDARIRVRTRRNALRRREPAWDDERAPIVRRFDGRAAVGARMFVPGVWCRGGERRERGRQTPSGGQPEISDFWQRRGTLFLAVSRRGSERDAPNRRPRRLRPPWISRYPQSASRKYEASSPEVSGFWLVVRSRRALTTPSSTNRQASGRVG
jgi:hypothetical protein